MKKVLQRIICVILVMIFSFSVAPLNSFFSIESSAAGYPAIPALQITRVRQGPNMCTWASLSTVQGYCSGTYEGYNYRQPGVDFYYGAGKSADLSNKNDPMSKLITKKCVDGDWGSSMKNKLPHEMVYVTSGIGNNTATYEKIYNQLKQGKPVILYLGNYVHTSVVIAYNGSSSKLEASGFTVMDVAKDTWENSASYYSKYANNPQSITKYDSCYVTLSSWLSYDGGRTIKAIYYPKNSVNGSVSEPTFKFNSVKAENITKTDAQISATFDLQKIDSSGFYIGTSQSDMKKISKSLSGNVDGAGTFEKIYYKMSNWYGKLSPGTTYYYQLYVIKNGKEFKTDIKFFKTLSETYTIRYDANGGTNAPADISADSGVAIHISDIVPVKSGNVFLGWATDSSSDTVKYNPGDSLVVSGNITLYAVWRCDHAHTEIKNKKTATCVSDGYSGDTYCSACGKQIRTGFLVIATGHNYVGVVTDSTCVTGGFTTYTCSVCGDIYIADQTVPKGHIPGEWIVIAVPVFGKSGIEQKKCQICGEVLEEREISTTEASTKPESATAESTIKPPIYPVMGDTNGDGKITAMDARLSLRMSAKLDVPTASQLYAADVNGDGKITATDARKILRVAARLEKF